METYLEIQQLHTQATAILTEIRENIALIDSKTARKCEKIANNAKKSELRALIQLEESRLLALKTRNERKKLAISALKSASNVNLPQIFPLKVPSQSPLSLHNPTNSAKIAIQWFETHLLFRFERVAEGLKIVFLYEKGRESWVILGCKSKEYEWIGSEPGVEGEVSRGLMRALNERQEWRVFLYQVRAALG